MSELDVTLPVPLQDGQHVDRARYAILIVGATGERYAVRRDGLRRFSKFARDLLEPNDDDNGIPLGAEQCTSHVVALLTLWLNHHADVEVPFTQVTYPISEGPLEEIFDRWDLHFITTHLVPGGNMRQHRNLYMLSVLAVYLNVTVLQELCCAYWAWHIQQATRSWKDGGRTATAEVRGWFGLDGDFSEAELERIKEEHQWTMAVDYNQIERDSAAAHQMAVEYAPDAAASMT